jgi:hypothetical protein
MLPEILDCYANLALEADDPRRAASLFGTAEALREHLGARLLASEKILNDASLTRLQKMLPAPVLQKEWEAGRLLSAWDAIAGPKGRTAERAPREEVAAGRIS